MGGGRLPALPALPALQSPRWGLLSLLPLGSIKPAPSTPSLHHLTARDVGPPRREAEDRAGEKPLGKRCGRSFPCAWEATGSSDPSWVSYGYFMPPPNNHTRLGVPSAPGTKPLMLKHVRWIQRGKRGRKICGSKPSSISSDASVSPHPNPRRGCPRLAPRAIPSLFPSPQSSARPRVEPKGEGAVGREEPFLLQHGSPALGL